jgi:hypothetical protein
VEKAGLRRLPTPDSLGQVSSLTTSEPAPASARPISFVSKGEMLLKDATKVPLPKLDDKSSITFFFATPGTRTPGLTSLSQEGTEQAARLTGTMAQAGLTHVYGEGNFGIQTALGVAKENQSEFMLLKADLANETLKEILHNHMGKRVLVVASPAIVSDWLIQLAGKQVVTVPSAASPVLYYAVAQGMGKAQVMELSY